MEFGGLTSHQRRTRDASTSLCSSTSEIRQHDNRVTYQENVEEESGGFEEGGEKTRFGTLQKQRKQLNNEYMAHSNISTTRTHVNQVRTPRFLIKKSFGKPMPSLLGKVCFSF